MERKGEICRNKSTCVCVICDDRFRAVFFAETQEREPRVFIAAPLDRGGCSPFGNRRDSGLYEGIIREGLDVALEVFE